MPVCYGVARWSYGGDTVHAGRATVMPRNKPALFRTRCVPVIFLKLSGPLHGECRFNTLYLDSMRCLNIYAKGGPRLCQVFIHEQQRYRFKQEMSVSSLLSVKHFYNRHNITTWASYRNPLCKKWYATLVKLCRYKTGLVYWMLVYEPG